MTGQFGIIVGLDYVPTLRVMLVCPLSPAEQVASSSDYLVYHAIVLCDDPTSPNHWLPGDVVTVSPAAPGVTVHGHALDPFVTP